MSSNEDKYNHQLTRLGKRQATREEQIWFRKYNAVQRAINTINKEIRILKTGKNIVASSPTVIIVPTVAHSDTTGKTVDDHHNKLHTAQHNTDGDDSLNVDGIQFEINPSVTPQEGLVHWNVIDKTMNLPTDTDTTIQVGQEVVVRIINKTGAQLDNGTVVYINGADVTADRPTATKADASTWEDSQTTIGVMTSDVADDAEGFVTVLGYVRDVDTSGMTAGDALYLSETAGAYTTTRPTSPAYIIDLGIVVKVNATTGIIFINVINRDDYGYFNGTFVESFDLTVAESGGNIIASLQREGGGNLTMRFGSNFTTLTTPPMTKTLTPGTATVPKANYLYILESDQTQITLSTSSYPTTVAHIKIAKVVVFTAAITATDDALANQNVNDHAVDTIGMGHDAHIGEWIRSQPASWVSGVGGNSATGDDYLDITTVPDAVHFVSVAGNIRQLHLQTYAARDNTDWVYVINDPDAAYTKVTELIAGIDKLSTGGAIGNNKYFALVFWGIQNKSGEQSQLICNLPAGQYNSQLGAENDINGFTNVDIPDEYISTGFLICKLVIQLSGTTWVYKSTLDLRGTNPSIVTGAGGGSAIVSFPDNTFEIFDSDDPTKLINLQASGITTGNTRVATMPDKDLTLIDTADALAVVEAEPTLDLAGVVTITPDTDSVLAAGKAKLGYDGANADSMFLAHYDNMSNVNAALRQTAAGETQINAKAGQAVKLSVNSSVVANILSTGLQVGGGARITEVENNDSLGTSDTKLATQGNTKAYVDSKDHHSVFTPGTAVANHSDITNAGSGIIISAAERTALHAEVAPFPSGLYWLPATNSLSGSFASSVLSNGQGAYPNSTADEAWILLHLDKDTSLTINGVTKRLKITQVIAYWFQTGATEDHSRLVITKRKADGTGATVKDDTTDQGSAGTHESRTFSSFANNTLLADDEWFEMIWYRRVTNPAGDMWYKGLMITYEYV